MGRALQESAWLVRGRAKGSIQYSLGQGVRDERGLGLVINSYNGINPTIKSFFVLCLKRMHNGEGHEDTTMRDEQSRRMVCVCDLVLSEKNPSTYANFAPEV